MALDAKVHKLRLNPGNIHNKDGVREVVKRAKEQGTPIRIGVNHGSDRRPRAGRHPRRSPAHGRPRALRDPASSRSSTSTTSSSAEGVRVPVMIAAYRRLARPSRTRCTSASPRRARRARGLDPLRRGHERPALRRHRRHDPRLARRGSGRWRSRRRFDILQVARACATRASRWSRARRAAARRSTSSRSRRSPRSVCARCRCR